MYVYKKNKWAYSDLENLIYVRLGLYMNN